MSTRKQQQPSTVSHEQFFGNPRFSQKPKFGSTALLVTVGPRAPARQMVVRIVLCPRQQESRIEGTSQTYTSCSLIFKKWHRFCRVRMCRLISSSTRHAPPPPPGVW